MLAAPGNREALACGVRDQSLYAKEKAIDKAFCEWAASKAGQRIQQWDRTMYFDALREPFKRPQGPADLSGRVVRALNLAAQQNGLPVLGALLNQLLQMDWHQVGGGIVERHSTTDQLRL